MLIKTSEFLTSATSKTQYPEPILPEIAFCGRSNVGKSSIINSITNRKALARVSNTPGRTRLVNFFLINKACYLVDLPGYGYAKVSKKDIEVFGQIIESYLSERENIKKLILLVDSRHVPTEDDKMMYNYIKACNIPCLVVGTKLDKLKRNEIKKNTQIIRDTLEMDDEDEIILFSSLTKENRDEMLKMAFSNLGIDFETGELNEEGEQNLIDANEELEKKVDISNINKETLLNREPQEKAKVRKRKLLKEKAIQDEKNRKNGVKTNKQTKTVTPKRSKNTPKASKLKGKSFSIQRSKKA